MSGMTDAGEVAMLNHTIGATPFPFPAQIWFAWNTADPTDAGQQTAEIGRTQYTGGFGSASGGVISNSTLLSVPTAGFSSDANPITHAALVYTSTAGTYYWTDQLTNPITFTLGETLEIPVGGFVFRTNSVATLPEYDVSDNCRNKWLDHLFGTTTWTTSGSPVVRLHTARPDQTGLNAEFTGGGYGPQPFSFTGTDSLAGATRARNDTLIQFLDSQSDPYHSWTIHRGTDYLYTHENVTPKTVPAGSTIDFPINRMEVLVS